MSLPNFVNTSALVGGFADAVNQYLIALNAMRSNPNCDAAINRLLKYLSGAASGRSTDTTIYPSRTFE